MQIPANPKVWYYRETLRIPEVNGFYTACNAGREASCLFCAAIMAEPLQEGDEILVLSDFMASTKAVVAPEAERLSDRPWTVMLRCEGAPDGELIMFDQSRYLAGHFPLPPWPPWFPPLFLQDAADLHNAVLRFCSNLEGQDFDWRRFYEVIDVVWLKRLPIKPSELGAMLVAHGTPRELEQSLIHVFGHGRDLLVFAMGRRPVKKRRTDYRRTRRSDRAGQKL